MRGLTRGFAPILAGLLVFTAPAGADELHPVHEDAIERIAAVVQGSGDAELAAAFARLREAGTLSQLLRTYDELLGEGMEGGYEGGPEGEGEGEGDGDGGFPDPVVAAGCRDALRRHFQQEGMLEGDDETSEGIHFEVLRADESRPGWFHCEAAVGGGEGDSPYYDCYLVNPDTGAVEAEACG